MKHNPLKARIISACLVLSAFTMGASSSRSQSINSSATSVQHTNFYIRIGGISGPAKGYFNKGIECHGFNTAIKVPDRLKAGTYAVRIVDADGKIYSGLSTASITITSQPKDVVSGLASGKRMHKPMTITKEIDKATPLMFSIDAGDVDGDGMLDVMMAVKGQGVPNIDGKQ